MNTPFSSCLSSSVLSKITVITLGLSMTGFTYAQDSLDDAKRQIPTNKEGIENTVDIAKEAVKPALTKDTAKKNLDLMRKRAAAMRETQKDYLQKIGSGEILPWETLQKRYPAMQKEVDTLKYSLVSIQNEKDPRKRAEIRRVVQTALNLIGPYLKSADYRESDISITTKQVAEYKQFEKPSIKLEVQH